MSYKSYRARVERQRAGLKTVLEYANALRHDAQLPTRDISAELNGQCPLLSEEAWTAQQQERRAFARFRREQLAGKVLSAPLAKADWQEQRALVLRRAFLEHQLRQTWLTQPHAGIIQASPHNPEIALWSP